MQPTDKPYTDVSEPGRETFKDFRKVELSLCWAYFSVCIIGSRTLARPSVLHVAGAWDFPCACQSNLQENVPTSCIESLTIERAQEKYEVARRSLTDSLGLAV